MSTGHLLIGGGLRGSQCSMNQGPRKLPPFSHLLCRPTLESAISSSRLTPRGRACSLCQWKRLCRRAQVSAHHAVFPLCGSKALCASASPGPGLGWSAPERVPRSGESSLRTGRRERRAKAWEKGALGQQKRGAGSETETALRSGAGEALQELDSVYRGLTPYREHLHLCQACHQCSPNSQWPHILSPLSGTFFLLILYPKIPTPTIQISPKMSLS